MPWNEKLLIVAMIVFPLAICFCLLEAGWEPCMTSRGIVLCKP